jgi:hypothetical protein
MTTETVARTMQSPRAAFAATVALVFLSGAVVGALAMNFGVHKGLHQSAFWTEPGRGISVHRLQRELDLTPEQTEQLTSILADFAHYYEDVLANGKTRIYTILNDDQKRKFDRLLHESQAK